MKRAGAIAGLCLALVAPGWAAEVGVPRAGSPDMSRKHPFELRANVGGSFDPGAFFLGAEGGWHPDRFLSLGPLLAGGVASGGDGYFLWSLGGRLHWPVYPLKRVEASLRIGAGMYHRVADGLRYDDFNFDSGLNLDYFLLNELTVGMGGALYVTSNKQERVVGALLLSVCYRL